MPTIKKSAVMRSAKQAKDKETLPNNVTSISSARKKTKAVEVKIISEKTPAKTTVKKPIAKKPVEKTPAKTTVKKPIAKKPVEKNPAKTTVKKPIAKKPVEKGSKKSAKKENSIHAFFVRNDTKNDIMNFLSGQKVISIQKMDDTTNKEIYNSAMMSIVKESLTKDVNLGKSNARR